MKHKHTPQEREENFQARIQRAVANRGAFPLIAGVTFALSIVFGAMARLIAHDDFDSFGDAVWWALVTLMTVGYGDIVPESVAGRTIGVAVMVLGVTFLSFLTATVTSMFVASDERKREDLRLMREDELRAMLSRIEERLEAIESRSSSSQ